MKCPSLNASLATIMSGLTAEQGALQATTNNVANANTPGYTREVPVLITSDPVVVDPSALGTGVTLLDPSKACAIRFSNRAFSRRHRPRASGAHSLPHWNRRRSGSPAALVILAQPSRASSTA